MKIINLSEDYTFEKMFPEAECPYLKFVNQFNNDKHDKCSVDLVSAMIGIMESWAYRKSITNPEEMHDNWYKGKTEKQESGETIKFRISPCGEPRKLEFDDANFDKIANAIAFGEVTEKEEKWTVRKFNGELYCFLYDVSESDIYANTDYSYVININKNEKSYIEYPHLKLIAKYIKNDKVSKDILPEGVKLPEDI